MSDEQAMLYIEPEDDVTTVRERLRETPGKHITLVIPPQSQLHTQMIWKLLHRRARELGKDVLVVCPDPLIRSLARAENFRVAHSLESPSRGGKSRPPSRPGRSVPGTSKARPGRGIRSSSGTSERGPNIPRSPRSVPPPIEAEQPWYADLGSVPSNRGYEAPQIQDLGSDDAITGGMNAPRDPFPLFGPSERGSQGQFYDFPSHTTPPIYPVPDQVIEEQDPLLEDMRQASDIRRAAIEGRKRLEQASQPATGPEHTTSVPRIEAEPFAYMEDSQPPPPAEQRAGAVIEGFEGDDSHIDEGQKVEEPPTHIIDNAIEDRGDRDDYVPPVSEKPITTHAKPEDEAIAPPPARSRSRRSGNLPTGPVAPSRPDLDDDALPPTPRRSKPLAPQVPVARASGSLAGQRPAGRTSGPIASGRPGSGPIAGQRTSAQASGAATTSSRAGQRPTAPPTLTRPPARGGRTGTTPLPGGIRPASSRTGGRQTTRRRGNRQAMLWLVVAAVLLIAFALGLYYGPTATITLTVKTQNYQHAVSAKAIVPQAGKAQPTLPAQKFSKSFTSKPGQGKATGTKSVGTQAATGLVLFTNNSDKDIIIPSGTTLTTSGNNKVTFVTNAETLIPAKDATGPGQRPTTIQASQPGENGNVDANTITLIPPESLQKIAQYNPPLAASDLQLTVTNEAKTTGGGAKPVPMITDADRDKVKNDLSNQLKGPIDAWVKTLPHDGYVGTPQLTTELINTPPSNQTVESGTFPATVKTTAIVLLVRNADLQKEAARQLSGFLKDEKDQRFKNTQILESSRAPIKMEQFKQNAGDANSLDLTFNATALAGPILPSTNQIQELVAGKSITDARVALESLSDAGNVRGVDIQTTPTILPLVTAWPDHINVIIQPETKR